MDYLNEEIRDIENVITNLGNIVISIKNKLNIMKDKMEVYEKKINNLENIMKTEEEIINDKIIKFFEELFGIKISKDILLEISMNKKKYNRKGRPSLNNNKGKQMRHVIPISFIDNMVKFHVIEKNNYKELLNALVENISLFVYDNEGICLNEKDYNEIKNINNNIKYNYKLRNKINNENIYIIEPINVKIIKNYININETHKNLYNKKKPNFIKYVIKQIIKETENNNFIKNVTILFTIFIYTLFNTRESISFPEEGNTLNYTIKLEEIDKKSCQIISLSYIEKNINDLKNNEGSIVRTTGLILNNLNDILGNYYTGLIDNKLIKKYNKDYNKCISDNNLEKFNETLNIEDINNIKYHIAKHLYFVFDYKNLENKVFIKINDKYKYDCEAILKVYEKAKSK